VLWIRSVAIYIVFFLQISAPVHTHIDAITYIDAIDTSRSISTVDTNPLTREYGGYGRSTLISPNFEGDLACLKETYVLSRRLTFDRRPWLNIEIILLSMPSTRLKHNRNTRLLKRAKTEPTARWGRWVFTTYFDPGSSVKVKHSFVRELSNIIEFEYMWPLFKSLRFGGRAGAVTIFTLRFWFRSA